jgi:integral membrane protein
MNLKTTLGQLRILAIAEGVSFLLFSLTMPLKYVYNIHSPNKIVGMGHGLLFIAYVLWVLLVAREKSWNRRTIFWAMLASLLPFGTFVADSKLFNKK